MNSFKMLLVLFIILQVLFDIAILMYINCIDKEEN